MESTRLQKVSKLLLKELSIIFQRTGAEYQRKMISVTEVRITSDLGMAKVFISIFPNDNKEDILSQITENKSKIRFELGKKIKNQVRKIPELSFHIDNSLDYAEKIDKLLKN